MDAGYRATRYLVLRCADHNSTDLHQPHWTRHSGSATAALRAGTLDGVALDAARTPHRDAMRVTTCSRSFL